ncbi:MAG: TenA family protein [Planctomycetes bacterium]|nr:TenA family protein [Planctomycetota bacterium]MBL7037869.1 TenA family protein [Pirellulaceae bacterium]
MLHELLWQLNADIARRCLEHPFVRGLADGSLDFAAFKRYVAQEAFFLRAYLRVYALAATDSDNLERARQFQRLMKGVLRELELHGSYAATLGIGLASVQPYWETTAYTDFLLRVAWQGEPDETVAALVPCMRLYSFLGTELSASLRPGHPYGDWITTYSSDWFKAQSEQVESILDEVATDSATVREVYRYAMQYELVFFSAPMEGA